MANVASGSAAAAQSIERFPSWVVAVVITTLRAMPRWVRGRPNWAAAAQAAVTPGTISDAKPCWRNAWASSPTRPKMEGSPPFSRTTLRPRRASRIIRRLMVSCRMDGRPARLPVWIFRQAWGAMARMSSPTRAS